MIGMILANDEIFITVIGLVAVSVVNYCAFWKRLTKRLFGNDDVRISMFTILSDEMVSLWRNTSASVRSIFDVQCITVPPESEVVHFAEPKTSMLASAALDRALTYVFTSDRPCHVSTIAMATKSGVMHFAKLDCIVLASATADRALAYILCSHATSRGQLVRAGATLIAFVPARSLYGS